MTTDAEYVERGLPLIAELINFLSSLSPALSSV